MNLQDACLARRQRLLQQLAPHAVLLIASAPVVTRNADNTYPYRQNSDFYYLTGFEEPGALLVLAPSYSQSAPDGRAEGAGCAGSILFCRPRDAVAEAWTGPRLGPGAAPTVLGVEQAFSIEQITKYLPAILRQRKILYVHLPVAGSDVVQQQLVQHVELCIAESSPALTPICATELIAPMRLYKDAYEIACMQRAADISVAAHLRVWRACVESPEALHEQTLAAHLQFEFMCAGADCAYPSIVAGGERSLVLHYMQNNQAIGQNDLVLIDAGAEYKNYAADITRTFPAGGSFTEAQAAVYDVVLAAQLEVIAAICPGVEFCDLQKIATRVLTQGLIKLGILHGDLSQLLAAQAYKRFYMHGVSHWLGLDVHDAGGRRAPSGAEHTLGENMCLTVEPGLYIPIADDIDAKWHGIGIRIEDDVLVTASGCEVFTKDLPKERNAIQSYWL